MLLGGAFRDIQALELQNGFINMQLLAGLAPCSKLTKLSMRDISMASTDEQLSSMLPAWLSAVTHLELHDSLPAIHVVKGIGARLQHLTFANKPTFRLSGIIGATRALTACKELRSIDVSVLDRVSLIASALHASLLRPCTICIMLLLQLHRVLQDRTE